MNKRTQEGYLTAVRPHFWLMMDIKPVEFISVKVENRDVKANITI